MATRFQLGTISSQAAPAGAVHAFAGASAPTGWLLCNGAAVSRTVYAALFGAIASAHGSGDGSTTFNLPDYRGRIIRGRDGGIARDPDRAGRTAANAGGNTGDNVGSVQGEATKKNGLTASITGSVGGSDGTHGHFNTPAANASGAQAGASFSVISDLTGGAGGSPSVSSNGSGHGHSHTLSATINTGDNETRPINAYVNYIIKV